MSTTHDNSRIDGNSHSCGLICGRVCFQSSGSRPATRKSSYGGHAGGDYDSELVDGKYLTTVPIISIGPGVPPTDGDDDGNIRPLHRPLRGLKDLKKPKEENVVDRYQNHRLLHKH